ncbi:Fip1 domain-containing protein [Rhizoctonia solani AG-1 IA]|uniref:Fip1 domain-containing protein n=1 Tax=Thanatephorus cucumeris (strain AG1-IA) TaxID=983506 RepID=L8WMM2_THACA|nr:Fip1 domain-containing protein [Rhizoctonia solani AG-1 IA]
MIMSGLVSESVVQPATMDDEDAFLYGDSSEPVEAPAPQPRPITVGSGSGDEVLDFELDEPAYETPPRTDHNLPEVIAPLVGLGLPQEQLQPQQQIEEENQEENDDQDAEEEGDSEEEEDSEDVSVTILKFASHSPSIRRTLKSSLRRPLVPSTFVLHAPTDLQYKPPALHQLLSVPSQSTPQPQQSPQSLNQMQLPPQNQADLLPDPVRAPPSHPTIDPSAPGMMVVPGTLQSRPVWEVDLESLSAKSWRRPGANISDWFNYGFDEISWETYCMTRKKLGETASGLKANALEVAGLPEDQFLNLPPEMRSVVLGTAAMLPLPGQGGNPKRMGGVPGMGGPGPGMGPGMGPGGGMGPGAGMGPGGPVQGMGGPGPNMGGPGPNMGGGGPVMGGMGGMGGKMPMGMGPNTGMGMMPNQNMMPMNMMNMPPEVLMQMGQMPGQVMGGMMNGHGQEEYEEEETLNSDNKTLEKAGDDKGQQFQSQGTPTQTAESLEVEVVCAVVRQRLVLAGSLHGVVDEATSTVQVNAPTFSLSQPKPPDVPFSKAQCAPLLLSHPTFLPVHGIPIPGHTKIRTVTGTVSSTVWTTVEIVSGLSPRMAVGIETVIVTGSANGKGSASVIVIVTERGTGTIESGIESGIETVIGTERETGTETGNGNGERVRSETKLDLGGNGHTLERVTKGVDPNGVSAHSLRWSWRGCLCLGVSLFYSYPIVFSSVGMPLSENLFSRM